jgi:transcription-repair coupling factor (superfamily II helicase)
VHERLTLYKRISSARDIDALRDLQIEMIDRFGMLPEQTKQLFAVTELKLAATTLGIRKLDLGANGGRVVFTAKPDIDPMSVIRLVQSQSKTYQLDGADKMKIKLEIPDAVTRLQAARGLLTYLGGRA